MDRRKSFWDYNAVLIRLLSKNRVIISNYGKTADFILAGFYKTFSHRKVIRKVVWLLGLGLFFNEGRTGMDSCITTQPSLTLVFACNVDSGSAKRISASHLFNGILRGNCAQ